MHPFYIQRKKPKTSTNSVFLLIPECPKYGISCHLMFSPPIVTSTSIKPESIDFRFPSFRSPRYISIWTFSHRGVPSIKKKVSFYLKSCLFLSFLVSFKIVIHQNSLVWFNIFLSKFYEVYESLYAMAMTIIRYNQIKTK